MDEFGVLTQKFGLKPQGKSAPMAASKRQQESTKVSNSGNGSRADDGNVVFNTSLKQGSDGYDGNFGGSLFDLESVLGGSSKGNVDDDIFGGMPGLSSSKDEGFSSDSVNDLLGGFGGNDEKSRGDAERGGAVGDLLGGFGGSEERWDGTGGKDEGGMEKSGDGMDDLLPGFGGSGDYDDGANVKTVQAQHSTSHSHEAATTSADPFIVFESGSTLGNTSFTDHLELLGELTSSGGTRPGGLRSPPSTDTVKDSDSTLLDDLEDFAMGRVANNTNKYGNFDSGETKEGSSPNANKFNETKDARYENLQKGDDLDSIFDMNSPSSSVSKPRATYTDPMFNADVYSQGGTGAAQETSSWVSANEEKASPYTNFDGLPSIFGEAASVSDEFEEIEGESEERRKSRLARFERINARAARALAEMNHRDRQSQREQEERNRVAEDMDAQIKHWAMGKEGNMRALLSSLQDVLWSECGWKPVSLTDLITSASVKVVYKKATVFVHPDKVQQKGANLQQKYIAEKVFHILKEAWNKFNKEELS